MRYIRTCPLTRGVRFLECPSIRDFIVFVSFPYSRAQAGDQYSFSNLSLSLPKQFCLYDMVSEMELEKPRTILHIGLQNCLLATRSHTQFHYICKITNTCLLLSNHLEMRSQKSRELVTPNSQQSSNVALAFFKNFQRYKEKLLSLPVNKFMCFYFLLELRINCHQLPGSLAFPIVLTTKKTLIVIKTIVKTKDPG